MRHIIDILDRAWDRDDCFGCALGCGEIPPPGGLIAETSNFILHQDPEVLIRGFLIISAKRHLQSLAQMSPAEAQELFSLVYQARLALEKVIPGVVVTLIQEERSGHFHLWLLPRCAWMDEFFDPSLNNIRPLMAYAKTHRKTEAGIREILETVEAVRQAM